MIHIVLRSTQTLISSPFRLLLALTLSLGPIAGQAQVDSLQNANEMLGNFRAVVAPTDSTVMIVGDQGKILRSKNGGATWKVVCSQTESTTALYNIAFAGGLNGLAVGQGGKILYTKDGGMTWAPGRSGTRETLFGVALVEGKETRGWAVGGHGTILRTSDGGISWIPSVSGVDVYLNSIFFINASEGWTCGISGEILHTSDGGKIWKERLPGLTTALNAIHFVTPSIGWAVGGYGSIVKTENGGVSWIKQNIRPEFEDFKTKDMLTACSFRDALNGLVVGTGQNLLRTVDGGSTYIEQKVATEEVLMGVSFSSRSIGWLVGYDGCLLKTTDGGATWKFVAIHFE